MRQNYRFERSERDRVKRAKREEKLKRKEERAATRREDPSPDAVGGTAEDAAEDKDQSAS